MVGMLVLRRLGTILPRTHDNETKGGVVRSAELLGQGGRGRCKHWSSQKHKLPFGHAFCSFKATAGCRMTAAFFSDRFYASAFFVA